MYKVRPPPLGAWCDCTSRTPLKPALHTQTGESSISNGTLSAYFKPNLGDLWRRGGSMEAKELYTLTLSLITLISSLLLRGFT